MAGALSYRPLCRACRARLRFALHRLPVCPGPLPRGAAEPARRAAPQEWFGGVSLLGFLRDVGKHARVGTMLSRDSVRSRMEADNEGMSFTECAPGPAWTWAALWRIIGVIIMP